MQRLLYIIFLSFFLLGSCAKQKPSGVLSESKIIDLLTEVALIDAYLNTLPIDSGRQVMPVLYNNLFNQFGIDSNQFEVNLNFYYGNPSLTESIYKKIDIKLREEENKYRIEDSIRNAFVSDSLQRVYKIQSLVEERRNLTLNYYNDSHEPLSYSDYAMKMLNSLGMNLMAYGYQVPVVPSSNQILIPEEPITQDSVLNRYLKIPLKQFLLEAKKDSSSIDYRILNILFLKNSGLNVRTGHTYTPATSNNQSSDSNLSVDSLSQSAIDTLALEPVVSDLDEANPELRPLNDKSIMRLKPVEE